MTAAPPRPQAAWNPWTVIRTTNPLFYLTYAASSMLLGGFFGLVGVLALPALPWLAGTVCTWERHRVTLLGVPVVASDPHRRRTGPWLWSRDVDVRDLGGWAVSVLFCVVNWVATFVCGLFGLVAATVLFGVGDLGGTLVGLLLLAIAVAVTLMAAAASSALQVTLVRRLLAPVDDPLRRQVAELTDSRARIVDGFEVERRRIERDLHDGAQQFLVASSMKVGEAALVLEQSGLHHPAVSRAAVLLGAAQDDSDAALKALRETVAGIHPKVLSDRGLEAAVRDVAARQHLPVRVVVPEPLRPVDPSAAAAAYFLVAEALTNVAKHAPGAGAQVLLSTGDNLLVSVTDAGPGGATVRPGGGLAGLCDRFAAMGGRVAVVSPAGGPTLVTGEVPLVVGVAR